MRDADREEIIPQICLGKTVAFAETIMGVKDSDSEAFAKLRGPDWLTYSYSELENKSQSALNSKEEIKVSEIKWRKMCRQVSRVRKES